MSNTTVAQTILDQLGGKRFMVMTGAKVSSFDDTSITLKLTIGKLSAFKVILDLGTDTYNVHCFIGKGLKMRLAKDPMHDVYAEDLVRIFETETGLYTHL